MTTTTWPPATRNNLTSVAFMSEGCQWSLSVHVRLSVRPMHMCFWHEHKKSLKAGADISCGIRNWWGQSSKGQCLRQQNPESQLYGDRVNRACITAWLTAIVEPFQVLVNSGTLPQNRTESREFIFPNYSSLLLHSSFPPFLSSFCFLSPFLSFFLVQSQGVTGAL